MRSLIKVKPEPIVGGRLVYLSNELSMDYVPTDDNDVSTDNELTLSIGGTLQLLVAIPSKRLLYAFGYCPLESLKNHAIQPPVFTEGSAYLTNEVDEADTRMSHSTSLDDIKGLYDKNNGWIQFGASSKSHNILIANGVGISLENQKLVGLWLKPIIETP